MARFGINTKNALAVKIPFLRKLAKQIGKDHALAIALWDTGIHEARILAGMIDEPEKVSSKQLEIWVSDFDSWDVCDQVCLNLFSYMKNAREIAIRWSKRDEEYVKRAGFSMMAILAVHNKETDDKYFLELFPYIEKGAVDERNYVKKSVNWAVRQIGKRNSGLKKPAITLCNKLLLMESKSARWIARDALRELETV
ncbi:MAG: DNA alkylation repair protein [Nanoarchaeota archaeon]|nr:DNA alkylation repair protein [Nanoarchaeota archaeon]